MKHDANIQALRDAIQDANTKGTYGLYKIKNIVATAEDLDNLETPLELLAEGYNLKTYLLTKEQKQILEAYRIDIEIGKNINVETITKE